MVTIRAINTTDAESVQDILTSCTRELRAVYAPKPQSEAVASQPTIQRVVAVDQTNMVIGVADCIVQPFSLYVQGIAVAPTHRRRGIASALLGYIATLAIDKNLPTLQVATIKETGNVEIFKRIGFTVIEERISERFLGSHGQPVTEVTLKQDVT